MQVGPDLAFAESARFVRSVVHLFSHDRSWGGTGSENGLSEAVWRTILRASTSFRCLAAWVDFSHTPEHHIAFCPIFVHPLEFFALNAILFFTSFLSKVQIFSCFEHFFRQGVRIEPHVAFRVVFLHHHLPLLQRQMFVRYTRSSRACQCVSCQPGCRSDPGG